MIKSSIKWSLIAGGLGDWRMKTSSSLTDEWIWTDVSSDKNLETWHGVKAIPNLDFMDGMGWDRYGYRMIDRVRVRVTVRVRVEGVTVVVGVADLLWWNQRKRLQGEEMKWKWNRNHQHHLCLNLNPKETCVDSKDWQMMMNKKEMNDRSFVGRIGWGDIKEMINNEPSSYSFSQLWVTVTFWSQNKCGVSASSGLI